MQKNMTSLPVFLLLLLICLCKSDERLTPAKPLSPGDKLISKDGIFALGFFSPTNSTTNLYVGIWYHNISERTYVWVANRDNPITSNLSGKLVVTNNSDLVLSDSKGGVLWTTKNNITGGHGAVAVLLNTGNFVLRSPNGTEIWQSFDHPTDTVLPGLKLWVNYKTHKAGRIVAWKGSQDPSSGNFSLGGDPILGFQVLIWHGASPYWRSFAGGCNVAGDPFLNQIVDDGEEISGTYNEAEGSQRTHWKLDFMGNVRYRIWNNQSSSWTDRFEISVNGCLHYGSCGPFGYCDITGAIQECKCLDGFEPASGFNLDISRGCLRKEALKCGGEDQFLTLPRMKVPDKFLYVRNRSFEECAAECNRNCSCTAYAYANFYAITVGNHSRCLVWMGELVDMGTASDFGENLYLRLAGSPGHNSAANKKKSSMVIKIVLPIISCQLILACIYLVSICKSRAKRRNKEALKRPVLGHLSTFPELWDKNLEYPCVGFEDIAAATNSFHDANMLGKGGFGNVYKGTLEDGKEVAVKRLSKGSDQGMEHFRNEVVLIAKLQHKNLVRLFGCCIREDEKLLIYEYLPNKSLDKFLFDDTRKSMLDWPTRFNIIKGVARGLLYLHQDSRMTIIHRDLKASNILLDAEMNPKISDFGMARIFGGNEQQASTKRVVGTYGYMSPEYAMEGIFSVKTDTYSFGILVLEIVSGLKISPPHHLKMDFPNLIAYAWSLWADGKARDFVDTLVLESYSLSEVFQCIHIGLLCVQDSPNARPLMSVVVSMLENEAIPRPMPKQPMYFAQRNYGAEEVREDLENSVNNVSLTALEGR